MIDCEDKNSRADHRTAINRNGMFASLREHKLSLHFIEEMAPLLNAADEAEWFGAIAGLAETWGFDKLLIAMLPRPTIRLEDAYVRSTYAPKWRRTYDEQGLVHIDPTVSHCATRATPLIGRPTFSARHSNSRCMRKPARTACAPVSLCRFMDQTRKPA